MRSVPVPSLLGISCLYRLFHWLFHCGAHNLTCCGRVKLPGSYVQEIAKSVQQMKQKVIDLQSYAPMEGTSSKTTSPIWRVLIGEHDPPFLMWFAAHFAL